MPGRIRSPDKARARGCGPVSSHLDGAGAQLNFGRQQVREARKVASEPPLFCAEQVPACTNTNGICQLDDSQLVAVCV